MSGERETLLIEPVRRPDGDLVSITRVSELPETVDLNIGTYSINYTDEFIFDLGGGDFHQGLFKVARFGLNVTKQRLALGGCLFPTMD